MRKLNLFFAVMAVVASAAELPVREVVLYKHGVGFFERAGDLAAGESARLDFKATEMDDVLKSLTIDAQGSKIAGLRYDSAEPLAVKLAEFPFALDQAPTLAYFMNQMRGAALELKMGGGETVSGAIVNGRIVPATQNAREQEQVVLLMDTGDLRTFDLGAATALRFPDAKLQLQLKEYLKVVSAARSKDKRSLYIDSVDTGTRHIAASYMVPMPVWKSTYRLIFASSGDPTLEGWAIVDNTTGEDWTKVRLAVVSGRPMSFISRLYEPKYVARQVAGLADENAVAPVVMEGAMQAAPAPPPPPPPARAFAERLDVGVVGGVPGGVAGGTLGALRAGTGAAPGAPQVRQLMRNIQPTLMETAAARELGELFEYRFATPVTVKKGESAMLPFLQQKLATRKLLIYQNTDDTNPMNAAELTNATGKTLDGGPITVYDTGSYAGEALMDTVKPGDKRLITYGIDLGTRITTAFETSAAIIREIHANDGILTMRHAGRETTTYTIRNVDARPKTLIVERPQRPEYKLVDRKPTETTRTANRFEVKLGATSSEKFAVTEEREYSSEWAVTNMRTDEILAFEENRPLSETGRKKLQQIADKKEALVALDKQIHDNEQDTNTLVRDQDRIRQNIGSLNRVQGQQEQVQKYAKTLADQESRLADMRDKLSEMRKRRDALDAEIVGLIEKLEF